MGGVWRFFVRISGRRWKASIARDIDPATAGSALAVVRASWPGSIKHYNFPRRPGLVFGTPGANVSKTAAIDYNGITPHSSRNAAVESNSARASVDSSSVPLGTKMIIPWRALVSRTRYALRRKVRLSTFLMDTQRLLGPKINLRNCQPLPSCQTQSPPQHRPIQSSSSP